MLDRIDDWTSYFSKDDTAQVINEKLNKHTRTGRPLIRQLEVVTGLRLMPQKPGPKG